MELMFKSTNENVIPLKQKENALISRYTKLIASAKIPFEGEEYNIEAFIKNIKEGPRFSRVEKVTVTELDQPKGYKKFELRY